MGYRGIQIFLNSAKSFLIGVIITSLMVMLFSLLLNLTGLPEKWEGSYVMMSLCMGCFFVGIRGGTIMGKRGIVWGVLYGTLFLFLMLSLAFLVMDASSYPSLFQPCFLICLFFSILGGTIGVNAKKQ